MNNKLYRMEEVGKLVKDNFPADSVNNAYIHSENLYRKCEDGQEFTNKLYPILLDTVQRYVDTANNMYNESDLEISRKYRNELDNIIYELELLVTTIMHNHICKKKEIRDNVDEAICDGYGYEKKIILDKKIVPVNIEEGETNE